MTALLGAFLAASVIVLAAAVTGAFVGAWIAHRAGRGESPLPSLPHRVKAIGAEKQQQDRSSKVELPDVRA